MANWPLIAIRIAENLLFFMVIAFSVVAVIIPIAITAGFSNFDFKNNAEPSEVLAALLIEHWLVIVYVLLIAAVVVLVLIAIHAFVEAGCARVFVDAERKAAGTAPPREAFRAFDMDRWLRGGRASWWIIFWIYNIVWGIGGLIVLIPLILTLGAMFLVSEVAGRIAVACGGLALTFGVVIPLVIVMAILTQKAITIAVGRSVNANESVRSGWREIRRDFGRHFAVAFIIFVFSLGGAMVISTFTAPMSIVRDIGHAPFTSLAFAPGQIISSVAQMVFSAAVGLWFLAAYVGLTEEK